MKKVTAIILFCVGGGVAGIASVYLFSNLIYDITDKRLAIYSVSMVGGILYGFLIYPWLKKIIRG